jgi:hypothetical protein
MQRPLQFNFRSIHFTLFLKLTTLGARHVSTKIRRHPRNLKSVGGIFKTSERQEDDGDYLQYFSTNRIKK